MSEIILVVLKILPVLLLIGLGIWLRKHSFVKLEAIQGIKKIVMDIALPALLFVTFLQTELKSEVFLLSIVIFVASSVAFGVGFVFRRVQKTANPFYPSLFATFLTGPFGFPLFIAYFGSENFYRLAILDVGNSLFLFTVMTVFLSTVSCDMRSVQKQSISTHLKNITKAPLAVSTFLGILFSVLGFGTGMDSNPVGLAVLDAVEMVGNVTVPMMLALAYLINKFVIQQWLQLDELYTAALYTMFILPPPFVIPLSIIGECEHKDYVLNFVSLHLFVSMIAFPVVMALL